MMYNIKEKNTDILTPDLGMLQAWSSGWMGSSQVFQGRKVSIWDWGVGCCIHWIASQLDTIHTS